MSNGSNGRKISQFNALTSVPSGSYFSFIYNGQNFKVADTDFYADLGVTGTLAQEGDPLGIPVLNSSGTVNNIRNIEPGSGILAEVSPEGGISLSTNFAFDSSGVELVEDKAANPLNFRSIIGGDGIDVGGSGGEITISATGATVSTKTVLVNQLSDFPDPVSEVITLEEDTEYFLLNDVDLLTNRLVFSDKSTLRGSDSVNITLTYGGSSTMLTSATGTNRIKLLTLSCASGSIVDITAPTGAIFRMTDITYDCDTFGVIQGGTFPDGGVLRFTNVSGTCATDGLTTTGNFNTLLYDTAAVNVNGGTFLDLDAATFDALYLNIIIANIASGTTFLSGATDSDNINANAIGSVTQCRIQGLGTPLSGITTNDSRWAFFENDEIADTRRDALMSIQGNASPTVIAVTSTPVKMVGTWTDEGVSGFEIDASGRMTYVGERNARLPIDITSTVITASGGDKQIAAYIAINGSVVLATKKVGTASSTKAASITLIWQHDFAPNDYVELFFANETNTDNVIGEGAVGRVN
jgi:hypothetical protein